MPGQEFIAKLSLGQSANIVANNVVKFDQLVKNLDGRYNAESGEFTAPYPAHYNITWKIFAGKNSTLDTVLMKNGKVFGLLVVKGEPDSEADGENINTVRTLLNVNDTICVKVGSLIGKASDEHEWEFIVTWENPKKLLETLNNQDKYRHKLQNLSIPLY